MKPMTREWVLKAEADFQTVLRELRARKNPNLDGACFHAQQCAEKYLKSRLQEAGIAFPKIHDLSKLLDLVLPLEPLWEIYRAELKALNAFAVEVRYPGRSATRNTAKEARRIVRQFRQVVRESLGLKN